MKTKQALIILAIGFLIDIIVVSAGMVHTWFLLLGFVFKIIGGALLLYKFIIHLKTKVFLKS